MIRGQVWTNNITMYLIPFDMREMMNLLYIYKNSLKKLLNTFDILKVYVEP